MKSTSYQYEQIFDKFREILKKKNITFKTLAQKLDLSESAVKLIFYRSNCSFKRILEICEVIGTPLQVLLDAIVEEQKKVKYFSDEQANFLRKNRNYYN